MVQNDSWPRGILFPKFGWNQMTRSCVMPYKVTCLNSFKNDVFRATSAPRAQWTFFWKFSKKSLSHQLQSIFRIPWPIRSRPERSSQPNLVIKNSLKRATPWNTFHQVWKRSYDAFACNPGNTNLLKWYQNRRISRKSRFASNQNM